MDACGWRRGGERVAEPQVVSAVARLVDQVEGAIHRRGVVDDCTRSGFVHRYAVAEISIRLAADQDISVSAVR